MSDVFFDTNVLVYLLGPLANLPEDPRRERAEQLVSRGGRVSVQVLNEFTDVAGRKLKLDWEKVASLLQMIEWLCGRALPLTQETHWSAVAVSKKFGLRIYDSMIVASALEAGCTTLFTEDLQHGQIIDGLRIENPFLA